MKKIDKTTIEQAVELRKQGFSYVAIGKQLNVSPDIISKHVRKTANLAKANFSKKIDQDKFDELWKAGKTDQEIADFFGAALTTVKTYRTKGKHGQYNIIRYFAQESHSLTEEQEQMIRGSLLGDMSLTKPSSNRSKNSRLALVHCTAQKDLFMKKVELLGDFMGSWREVIPAPDKRTGKVYTSYRGDSKAHQVFTDLYNELYFDGTKKITKAYLDKITSPIALAYWFMDDGTYRGTIATNCFTKEEVYLLSTWLYNRWSITTTVQHNQSHYVLHIIEPSRKSFEELIKPYMIESMFYKLKY